MKARSCGSSSLKRREFLKKWIKGLKICRIMKKDASILERRNAIKVAADVAIASTTRSCHWSWALLSDVVSRNRTNKILVQHILGDCKSRSSNISIACHCRRRILRRSRRRVGVGVVPKSECGGVMSSASSIANKLVKLRKLVPGGEQMDRLSLLQQTLHYIVSLRLQVNVMRQVAAAAAATSNV